MTYRAYMADTCTVLVHQILLKAGSALWEALASARKVTFNGFWLFPVPLDSCLSLVKTPYLA